MAPSTVAVAILAVLATPVAGSTFDYLHIEANEGNSSGGHVAIRFADRVYHFQHDHGLVRLRRDSWKHFEYLYRTLKNRGISVSRVEISPETYENLRSAFQRRFIVGEREIGLGDDLHRDTVLLEDLLASRGGATAARLRVPGAGFFEPTSLPADSVDGRILATMRRQVLARHGATFLGERRRDVERHLADLEPTSPHMPPPSTTRYPSTEPLFARRTTDLLAAATALDLLATPHRLRTDRLVTASARRPLSTRERARLRDAADTLAESLTRLIASRRPDWGYPFLLGTARLVALERSLQRGRWILLDALPSDAQALRLDSRRRHALPGLLADAEVDRDAAVQKVLAGDGFAESEWSELETAVTHVAELRRVRAGASTLRVRHGILLPRGEAPVSLATTPRFHPAQITRWLRAARQREADYTAALREAHGYNLLLRNCVSEIFRTIDTALLESGAEPENLRDASTERLGGYIAPLAGLNFIPFVSAQRVRSTYSVAANVELPSYRDYHVERMRASEPSLRVALRESNVWTSTLYTPSAEDGFFVFFTDRRLLLRPVLGAVNLLASTAESGFGVAMLPIDRGRSLHAGLSGALFSLPELLFVNLRKGSNDYVPTDMRPPGTP